MRRVQYLACALAVVATAGCGTNDNTLTNPSTTNELTVDFTDGVNGPLTPNGAQTFQFSTLTSGEVSVQLIDLEPDGPGGALVGLSLGIMDSSANCQVVVHKDDATLSSTVDATATAAGNLCARIYDANGTLPKPQTFDIRVTHP
ncbi:MAG TPA: hypothetical protein VHZ73_13635 [Vicinamibacterales bacterium]|jgi:hypothetical protein|nr:hypothetical protein [Vicinamibacterales bacterium]